MRLARVVLFLLESMPSGLLRIDRRKLGREGKGREGKGRGGMGWDGIRRMGRGWGYARLGELKSSRSLLCVHL